MQSKKSKVDNHRFHPIRAGDFTPAAKKVVSTTIQHDDYRCLLDNRRTDILNGAVDRLFGRLILPALVVAGVMAYKYILQKQ